MKGAVFSCNGLGDGLVVLTLSNNLKQNGYEIDTFHNNLDEMASWFSYLPIKRYPDIKEIPVLLEDYDKIFISYNDSSEFVMKLIKDGKASYKDKIYVLNPCPSRKLGRQPYYKDALFSPNISVVDNLQIFSQKILKLDKIAKEIKITTPDNLNYRKNVSRIVIHPTSAKKSKNWFSHKYVELATSLKNRGFDPVLVVSKKEENEWLWVREKSVELKTFADFNSLASYVYESGYMIGNDSGIGHLASILGLPTLTIYRNYRTAKLWRPGWTKGGVIFPNKLIPNISVFRLRDKYWQKFVSKEKVIKEFNKLLM